MEKLYKFDKFLNEKMEVSISNEVEKDAKKTASEMFDKVGNPKFEYKDGKPTYIVFEITETDYGISYGESLSMEYSENVLKKRAYKVELKYKKKYEEKKSEKSSKYFIRFKIKLTKTGDSGGETLIWEFSKRPTEVINFIKTQKQKCTWKYPKLTIYKASWDKLATAKVKALIKKAGGVKK